MSEDAKTRVEGNFEDWTLKAPFPHVIGPPHIENANIRFANPKLQLLTQSPD